MAMQDLHDSAVRQFAAIMNALSASRGWAAP